MNRNRPSAAFPLVAAVGLLALVALAPARPALACPGAEGKACACPEQCPGMQAGGCEDPAACPHAAAKGADPEAKAKEPADGEHGCPCSKGGASQETSGGEQGAMRAVIDPETGELRVPEEGEEAAPAARSASARSADHSAEIVSPEGGVSAKVGESFHSQSVAVIGEDGKAKVGCAHASANPSEAH